MRAFRAYFVSAEELTIWAAERIEVFSVNGAEETGYLHAEGAWKNEWLEDGLIKTESVWKNLR